MAEPVLADSVPPADAEPSAAGPAARGELIAGLTDVLALPEGRQTANERAFAAEILGAALLNAGLPERVGTARRLASVGNVPQGLLRQLLLDDAGVAGPLLAALAVIPEPTLVEAAGVSPEHRRAIAGRDGLSEAVIDALLATGDAEVARRVLGTDVPVSSARFDALVAASRNEPSLLAPLIARPDLQITHALTLFWWCDARTRRRLLTRFAVDRSVLQDRLQALFVAVYTDPEADPVVRRLLDVIDRRHRPRGRDGEMVTMDVVERTLTVARAHHEPDLCHAVGLLAGVGTPCATRVLDDPSGEPFAIMAKSIGVRRASFAAILDGARVIAPDEGPAASEAGRERMMACFDMITSDYARTALRYWDWRPEGTVAAPGPHAAPAAPTAADTGYLGAL